VLFEFGSIAVGSLWQKRLERDGIVGRVENFVAVAPGKREMTLSFIDDYQQMKEKTIHTR
jgi:hypothetical protein